jgi:hypothetical protein
MLSGRQAACRPTTAAGGRRARAARVGVAELSDVIDQALPLYGLGYFPMDARAAVLVDDHAAGDATQPRGRAVVSWSRPDCGAGATGCRRRGRRPDADPTPADVRRHTSYPSQSSEPVRSGWRQLPIWPSRTCASVTESSGSLARVWTSCATTTSAIDHSSSSPAAWKASRETQYAR